MSGFGGFGGFGANSQQQTTGGFGGFGQNNNNNNTGFGTTNPNTGFGSNNNNNTGGSLFGSTSGGFGSSNNTTPGFGANKPTFGGSTPFGANNNTTNTATTGFGGFGQNNNQTSTGFGSTSTATGLFGQAKPTFGSSTTNTGGGLFGGGGGGNTGFGGNNNTSAFGGGSGFGGSTGFGANTSQNNGTDGVPFQPVNEKDGQAPGSASVSYQSISTMEQYKNFSPEELRLVDYNKGKRYGTTNGQGGTFGQSTGFGGFGGTNNTPVASGFGTNTTGGGLFGSNNNQQQQTAGFGSNTTSTFGNATGGGLFGQNKPAGTGLFGSSATSGTTGGGLFGTSGGNTGFSGASNTTSSFGNNAPAVGLFGANNNQAQNKPAFGGFGTNTGTSAFGSNATGNAGFGQNNTTSTFGQQNNTSTGFGANNQQQNTTSAFGGFGQANQQQNTQQQSGGLFGGFGQANNNNQPKPSVFGSGATTNTGSGLFGQQNNQQQNTGGGLFGASNSQQQPVSSGLFGQKPAGTTGLFGSQPAATNTGGGLFGGLNSQNQQNQGTGLFGQNQNQARPSLFGASGSTGGGGLFGGQDQNPQQNTGLGGGLFGGSQQQQQQQPQMSNSLFGSQNQNRPQGLVASLDNLPYGNEQLFAHLENPTQSVGPIATPLSSNQKVKKNAILPQHKLNPAASTRLITPQKRPPTGFGFSYSTYGTPGSAVSNASPGSFASNLLSGSSFGKSLGKSFSTSNLRGAYTPDDSILSPGAFAATPRGYASGSLKRLQIDRNVNTSHQLFAPAEPNNGLAGSATALAPTPLRKAVSFGPGTAEGQPAEGSNSQALVRTPDEADSAKTNGAVNGFKATEVELGNGKALASVPENTSSSVQSAKPNPLETMKDKEPQEYYMQPSINELGNMSRDQLKRIKDFTVGRVNAGKIIFSEADLSSIPLDKIMGGIVEIQVRSAAAYPEGHTPVKKHPRGMGLNVPSTIVLENSWPRSKAGKLPVHENKGPRFEKHVSRLKRVPDTQFVSYDSKTGTWIFKVDHFTRYGMDYEGDDSNEDDDLGSSMLSAPPDTPTPSTRTPGRTPLSTLAQEDLSGLDDMDSELDDTFEFQRRKQKNIPGGFGDDSMMDHDVTDEDDTQNSTRSFLDDRSVGSFLENGQDKDAFDGEESESDRDQEMAGSFPVLAPTTEHVTAPATVSNSVARPKSILKVSRVDRSPMGTPSKKPVDFQDDWTTQLQRTVSPKKRDRQVLRESQGTVLHQKQIDFHVSTEPVNEEDQPFRTSVDIMNSLYGRNKAVLPTVQSKSNEDGLRSKVPFTKKPKITDANQLNDEDKAFHRCNKPHWSADGTLVYAIDANAPTLDEGMLVNISHPLVGEKKDIRFAQVAVPVNAVPDTMLYLKNFFGTRKDDEGIPRTYHDVPFSFAGFASRVDTSTTDGIHEHKVWQLASILFDKPNLDRAEDLPRNLSPRNEANFRKDLLSEFWKSIVQADADSQVRSSKVAESKALYHLSAHNVADACAALLEGRDFRLATLVAQIGGSESTRQEIAGQLEEWRGLNMLSEMTDTVRTMYELLAGNCSVSEGKSGSGPENKAATFKIGLRFDLDWRRAFGLRLWYGILPSEDIAMAVAQFESDLREGREDVKPVPWFAENGSRTTIGSHSNHLEDLLWGLLKLYAAQTKDISVNVEDILAPAAASGNPLDARLSWQLVTLLRTRKEIKLPVQRKLQSLDASMMSSTSSMQSTSNEGDPQSIEAVSDTLALTYGAMLEDTDAWKTCIFVYTYLSTASLRITNIKKVLNLKSGDFEVPSMSPNPSPAEDDIKSNYDVLASTLQIPFPWLHSAKALYARAVLQEPTLEIQHLLAAADYPSAHDVLCTAVAPSAIVARDYDILRELLGGFERPLSRHKPTLGKHVVHVGNSSSGRHWSQGGQVYFDFIHLMDTERGSSSRDPSSKEERRKVLTRLVNALAGMSKSLSDGKLGLQERVAVWEMARVTSGWVQGEGTISKSEIVKLPLMEDGWLRCARGRGVDYFRGVLEYAR